MTVAQRCSYIRITAFAEADSLIVIAAPLGPHFIIVVSILVFRYYALVQAQEYNGCKCEPF